MKRTMIQHKHMSSFQRSCCIVIKNLADSSDSMREMMIERSCTEMILSAVARFGTAETRLLQFCVDAMEALGWEHESLKRTDDALRVNGNVGLCMNVLEATRGHAALQAYACGALGMLARECRTKCVLARRNDWLVLVFRALQDAVGRANGNPFVVRDHQALHLGVLTQACGAIAVLMETYTPNQEHCSRTIPLVVNALQEYPLDAQLQRVGCSALLKLAKSGSRALLKLARFHLHLHTAPAGLGGIDVVLNSLRHHLGEAEVQRNGVSVLLLLAEHNESNQKVICEGGGLLLVIKAMDSHAMDSGVQYSCCAFIWILSKGFHAVWSELGAFERVLTAMRNHPRNADVQGNGFDAIHGLVKHGPTHAMSAAFLEEGNDGMDFVRRELICGKTKLQDFENVAVCPRIVALLATMSMEGGVSIRKALRDVGTVELVRMAMRRYNSYSRVHEDGSEVIRMLGG